MKSRPGDKRKKDDLNKKDKKPKTGERLRGFERRLDPERIVGATDSSGELMFLIKVRLFKFIKFQISHY